METDLRDSEPSSRAVERETARSAEQWANWTTDQIRSAIEAEREQTFDLLTEVLVRIKKDMIPEVVATLPALRGPVGPAGPVGKLPIAQEWHRETVYYEGSVVTYEGGSYQALRDTGEPPDNETHWQCLAAPGRDAKSFRHRGTFKYDVEYASHDIVALNGGSFLALHDKPGLCPGPGWQLLVAPGKRGVAGERGPQGDRGPAGVPGPPFRAACCRNRAGRYLNNSGRGSGMKPSRFGICTRGSVCASRTVALSIILPSARMKATTE
jgi:hypothetical protein